MQHHPKELGVQMAATACIYTLTKGEMGVKIHPHWLASVVKLTMNAMENFPNNQQVRFIHRKSYNFYYLVLHSSISIAEYFSSRIFLMISNDHRNLLQFSNFMKEDCTLKFFQLFNFVNQLML